MLLATNTDHRVLDALCRPLHHTPRLAPPCRLVRLCLSMDPVLQAVRFFRQRRGRCPREKTILCARRSSSTRRWASKCPRRALPPRGVSPSLPTMRCALPASRGHATAAGAAPTGRRTAVERTARLAGCSQWYALGCARPAMADGSPSPFCCSQRRLRRPTCQRSPRRLRTKYSSWASCRATCSTWPSRPTCCTTRRPRPPSKCSRRRSAPSRTGHICTGTALAAGHICTGTALAAGHICTGTRLAAGPICTGTGLAAVASQAQSRLYADELRMAREQNSALFAKACRARTHACTHIRPYAPKTHTSVVRTLRALQLQPHQWEHRLASAG